MKVRMKRWFEILSLLAIATIVVTLFFKHIQLLSDWLHYQNVLFRLMSIFLVSLCFWGFVYRTGGVRFKDLNPISYFKYPAIWLTSILYVLIFSIVTFFLFIKEISLQNLLFVISNFVVFLATLIILAIYNLMSKDKKKKKHENIKQFIQYDDILTDPQKTIEWVNTENPINNKQEDLFGHKYIAKKIRSIINKKFNKNIGIIGGYGSGKSSIINLVISGKTKEEIFCKIEGWGFKENTAIEHVLQLVIEDLKLNFDCLSIATLPKQYHEAMNNSGNNILPIISCFFQGTRNPINILKQIDTILECMNKKLIIVLEDIDRNINDATFYNEIASFLNVTKNFNRISFVLAIGPKNNLDSILTKLCEHNEYIQRIDKNEATSVITNLITYWYSLWPDDIKLQECDNVIKSLGLPKDEQEELVMQILNHKRPIDYICQLLDTPRKLKNVLREVDTVWHKLHGEIDFRSFFLAVTLKTAAPEAYKFINEEITNLRGLCSIKGKELDTAKAKEVLLANWEQTIKNVSWNIESARKIVCIFFPGFRDMSKDDEISYLIDKKTIQGFMNNHLTDYWKRLNVGRLLPKEIGDQVILKTIEGWKKEHTAKSYNGLGLTLSDAIFEIDGFDDKFEEFGDSLEANEIRELASELFKRALQEHGNNASQELCPGFTNLWRLSLKKDYSEHENWVINEIEKAIDVSLHFSNNIYYYWKAKSNYDVQAKTPTRELRKKVINIFKKKFENNPSKLLSVLDPSDPEELDMIVLIEREKGSIEEWNWLGQVLLKASDINPKLLTSKIACLLATPIKSTHDSDSNKTEINIDLIQEIFGDKISEVMQLLSKEFEYTEIVDDYKYGWTKRAIKNTMEQARAWLNSNQNK